MYCDTEILNMVKRVSDHKIQLEIDVSVLIVWIFRKSMSFGMRFAIPRSVS